ncbi:MAG: ATP-dependent helicase [bacterium]|nr:ATP-dependent helicase [bacterium]
MKTITLSQERVAGHAAIDYEHELNPEQLAVVREAEGACLVLAGAGTGKTRTIVYRVAWLLEQGVMPSEIVLLTFTNKASREMIERVTALLKNEVSGIMAGTFHSVANRLLRQFHETIGFQKHFTILDADDAKDFMKACIKDAGIDTTKRRFPSPAIVNSIVSFSRNADIPLAKIVEDRFSTFLSLLGEIEQVAGAYSAAKRKAQTMDFDDLLIFLRDLLRDNEGVRTMLSTQFRYVCVDEYQDTNHVQADIVRLLASHHGNVLAVGDDAQSIYSFRAADIQNILRFQKDFPGARIMRLETNYRSTQRILDFSNEVIAQNVVQYEKRLRATGELGELPLVAPCRDDREQARLIAQMVLSMQDEGVTLPQIAVLFRAAHHSQALEFELTKRDIPYEYRGGMRFFERAHIKDAIAFLKVIANPHDRMAWMRILTMHVGIGAAAGGSFVDLLEFGGGASVPSRAQRGWDEVQVIMTSLRQADAAQPAAIMQKLLASSYKTYLETTYPNAQERIEDLEQFAEFAATAASLIEFLSDVSLVEDIGAGRGDKGNTDEERMVLSTIHQAKGLEWHTVFVIHLVEDAFPNPRALRENGGEEEERRLFYVAATRAKRQLILTYPLSSGVDYMAFHQPSRFLTEVSKGFTEALGIKRQSSKRQEQERVIELDVNGDPIKSFLPSLEDL